MQDASAERLTPDNRRLRSEGMNLSMQLLFELSRTLFVSVREYTYIDASQFWRCVTREMGGSIQSVDDMRIVLSEAEAKTND